MPTFPIEKRPSNTRGETARQGRWRWVCAWMAPSGVGETGTGESRRLHVPLQLYSGYDSKDNKEPEGPGPVCSCHENSGRR